MEKQVIVAAFNCPNCGAAIAPDSPSCRYCGSAIATRLCPACYGSVAVGMRHCPHCGAEAVDSAPSSEAALQCPRCETNLVQITVGPHLLNTCPLCGGLWVVKAVFQSICAHQEEQEAVIGFQSEPSTEPAVPPQKAKRAYIPCPECRKLMNHKNFSGSGIVLDWCRDHGSWFDRNELQSIVRFIGDGGLRKAREREKLELKEQENRLRIQEFTMATLERRLDTQAGGRMDYSNTSDILAGFLSKMFQ